MEPFLVWRTHPFVEHPVRSAGLVAFLAALLFLTFTQYGPATSLLAAALLAASLAPYLFPTRYELNDEGVRQSMGLYRVHRRWEEFRNFYWDDVGVKLSTFSRRSRLEPYRGLFVRFAKDAGTGGNREEVLAVVRRHIARPEETAA